MDGGITATSLGNLAGRPRAANPCVAGRLSGEVGDETTAAHSSRRAIDRASPKGQVSARARARAVLGYGVTSVKLDRAQSRVPPQDLGTGHDDAPREST